LPVVILPTAVTGTAATTSVYSATLAGTVNPNGLATTAYFQYGYDTGDTMFYGWSTTPVIVGSGTSPVSVTASISVSFRNTEYHFRLVAVGADGTSYGADQTWMQQTPAPGVQLLPATVQNGSSVNFAATVNPNGYDTAAWFEYSTDPNDLYNTTNDTSLGSGTTSQALSATVTGLTPGTTYYYCVYASNAGGSTVSNVMSFTLSGSGGGTVSSGTLPVAPDLIAFTSALQSCTISAIGGQSGVHVAFVGTPWCGTASILANGDILYQPGLMFQGHDNFEYMVEDQAGNTAVGTVYIENPYSRGAGFYNTVIGATDAAYGDGGLIGLTVDPYGTVTGKVQVLGRTSRFVTHFRAEAAQVRAVAGKDSIMVWLSLDPLNQIVSGRVFSSSVLGTAFRAVRTPFTSANPAPQAGAYTMMFETSGSAIGVASARVKASGMASVTGWTPDGSPFTASAYIDGSNQLPIYAAPAHGELHGTTQFTSDWNVRTLDGSMGWSVSGSSAGNLLSVSTSPYQKPITGESMLGFASSAGNGVLSFGDTTGLQKSLNVTLGTTVLSSTSRQLTNLKVNTSTGLFSGCLTTNGTAKAAFYGAAMQPDGVGYGLQVQGARTGWVTLSGAITTSGGSGGFGGGGDGGTIITVSNETKAR
jgi:hypothetical protein